MASIIDVARVAKVSPSTVSMVVNHGHRVSPETRKRVHAAIRRLGYRGRDGNALDKARRRRALRLGFVYTPQAPEVETSYTRQIIQGIEQSLSGSASSLNIMRGADHVSADHLFSQQLQAGEFDGLMIVSPQPGDGYIERILDAAVPLVVFNRSTDLGAYSVVTLDYEGGGRQAIEHLVSLGHRRIALYIRSLATRWPGKVLHNGCLAALRRHGLEAVLDDLIPEHCGPEHWTRLGRSLMDAGVTAVQTGDNAALHLIDALEAMGVRVPDDMSVMGFDNRGRTTGSGLALSSIGYDRVRMGRMAGRMIERLSQSGCGLRWLGAAVKTNLVIGQTTASPCEKRMDTP